MDKNRLACSIQGLPHVGASCNFLYYLMFLCYCVIEIYSPQAESVPAPQGTVWSTEQSAWAWQSVP